MGRFGRYLKRQSEVNALSYASLSKTHSLSEDCPADIDHALSIHDGGMAKKAKGPREER
jgi:ribosomal protein S19E (S16A)